MLSADLHTVLPELILAVGAMALLMVGVFLKGERTASLVLWLTIALMVGLGLFIGFAGAGSVTAFKGAFVTDGFARFAKVLILFAAAAGLILSQDYMQRHKLLNFEFSVLFALATLGMMMMVSADDMLSLYMGLELQSLALYVLAAFRRDSARSTEAGLKYFVLSAISSGLLLYGISLIYGYTGATNFTSISEVVRADGVSTGLTFGLVFLCVGLAFKVSAAPFHMWTPDVYEGSPTPVTAYFASAPKVAAGVLFARVLLDAFGDSIDTWRQILVFLSIASMFLGAVAAIAQRNIKRLMAYSSISHMGYVLMGLAAGTVQGAQGLLFYLVVYVVMNIGMFAFIICMRRDGRPTTQISDLAGLARTNPSMALALAALMISFAGVPPLVGFFGKFFVFTAAIEAGLTTLAVAGAIASVISAFYYLRIVKIMYVDAPEEGVEFNLPGWHRVALGLSALAMATGWLPGLHGFGVIEISHAAASSLFP